MFDVILFREREANAFPEIQAARYFADCGLEIFLSLFVELFSDRLFALIAGRR